MRVTVFRALPDPFRKSMQIYADQLVRSVRPLLGEGEEIVDVMPEGVRTSPKPRRYYEQYVRYQRFSRKAAGDVNHIVDHGFGHLVRSLPSKRSIVTFHDATVVKVKGVSITTRLSLRYSLRAIRRAAIVVADSHATKRDFLELLDFPEDRVRVVYLGLDPAFKPQSNGSDVRARYRLPSEYILHVGHTLPYMNVEGVFRTVAELHRRGVRIPLVKVGAAFTGEQLRLAEELGIADRVMHLGMVPFSDLPFLYSLASVLLYPVRYAGFGLPPLEAMACGVPVVCSDRASLPEIVGDAAVTVDPDDISRYAHHIAGLLSDSALRDEYRRRGFANAGRFRWESTGEQMLSIYREVGSA